MGTWIQRAPMPPPSRPAVHCRRRHHLRHFRCRRSHGRCGRDLRCGQRHLDPGTAHSHQAGMAGRRPHRPQDLRGRRQTIRTAEEKKTYGHDYHFTSRDNLEMLDLDEQTWSALAPMPGGPRAGLAVTACQDQIWAIGGNTMLREDQRILDRVEVYNVATDTWAPGPALPRPTQGPTVVTHDGRIYLTGGISDEDPQRPCRSETYVLDPAVGRWEALAPVPTGRESSGSAYWAICSTPSAAKIRTTQQPPKSTTSRPIAGLKTHPCHWARPGCQPVW